MHERTRRGALQDCKGHDRVRGTGRPSKSVHISWMWHYIQYLSIPLFTISSADANYFRGTACSWQIAIAIGSNLANFRPILKSNNVFKVDPDFNLNFRRGAQIKKHLKCLWSRAHTLFLDMTLHKLIEASKRTDSGGLWDTGYSWFYIKVLEVYTHLMETIYLSLRAQVAVGTFFMKSPVNYRIL